MNQQQPDKFFRDKLENFSRPAPPGAWDKLEARLDNKNNAGLWWRVAAALLLVAAGTYGVWSLVKEREAPTPQANVPSPAKTNSTPTPAPTQVTPEKEPLVAKQAPALTAATQAGDNRRTTSKKTLPVNSTPVEPALQQSLTESTAPAPTTDEPMLPVADPEETVAVNEQAPPAVAGVETITLTFSAAETDNYITKNISDDATTDDKKSSTLKKLLKKAQDLKNNQDPFGELRQKKNEILALNFKNEKRGQNK